MGQGYDVVRNDHYALATTIYCILTNENPPAPETWNGDKQQWDTIHEMALEHLRTFLIGRWQPDNIKYINDIVSRRWVGYKGNLQ